MAAEIGSTESEEGWVPKGGLVRCLPGCECWGYLHWGLEEEDSDQDTDGSIAGGGADDSVHGDGDHGIDHEEEVSLEDGSQDGSDEAADGEGDESIGQHIGGLSRAEGGVLGSVVDEEAICTC